MTPSSQSSSRQRILEFVRSELLVHGGRSPSVREVQVALGFSAVQSAKQHLDALVEEGLLTRRAGARGYGLPLLPGGRPALHVPLLGRVQAGALTTAFEEAEGFIAIESQRGQRAMAALAPTELFALRVRGHSMRDAGILDGDLVIVRRQVPARDGDIVIALVGDEATVKTLRLLPGRIELVPANPDFAPIVIRPPDEPTLLGKVIEVRRYLDGTFAPSRTTREP